MRGGVFPCPIEPTPEENKAVSFIGGSSDGIRKAFTALNESLLIRTLENGSLIYRFKHPTIRDAFASLVADDLELMDIYLVGSPLDKLFNEISCGDVGINGVKVIVPNNRYNILITCIKSFDTSKWSNNYYLNNFLSHRCDSKFLELFIASNKQFIQQLKINSPLFLSDIDVIVRLFGFKLLPESERLRVVTAISELALKTPDSGFLGIEIKSLMTSDEFDNLSERIQSELIPNLDDKIVQWQNEYNRESDYFYKNDPEEYFDKLKNALEEYKNEFEEDETITEKIDNALEKIDSIVAALKSELPEDKKDEEELFNQNRPEDDKNNRRSIYDDVDL
jgi:predicted house-cleaning noncanonical NTP pyrophosphatase (MazG superfamily)